MEIRVSEKHTLGNTDGPRVAEEKWQVLTSCDISSMVIDNLCSQSGERNTTIACFYFDFAAQNEQSPASVLGSLLKQLVFGLEEIPEEISEAYRNRKNAIGGQGLRISDILKMLQITCARKRAFICIDALDECAAEHQIRLLDSLGQLLQQSPSTQVFVTGRPYIRPEIGRRLGGRVTSISISPKRDDIATYLHSRLAADTTPDTMDSTLEAGIMEKIPRDIAEMYVEAMTLRKLLKLSTNKHISRFLLVALNIDAVLQETTTRRRRQKLNAMTDGLGLESAYEESLSRVKGQGGAKARLGMAALMWISHSVRPLKVVELCHALAIEIGSSNLNGDDVPSIGTLLSCCQGLVAVDKEASTVRLIHFTFQEYLRAHGQFFGTIHSTIAETCLTYLNSRQIKTLSASSSPDLQDTHFLEYSSLYWGVHPKREISDRAKLLAFKLFGDYSDHISTRILLKEKEGYSYTIDFDKPHLFSGLHCASLFGIVKIVSEMIGTEGCDINQRDCVDNTPLVWAARDGHEQVIEILLKRGDVDPGKQGRDGLTPLLWAAFNGQEEVVKMLLERNEVNPDAPDNEGQTPLLSAAWNGHKGVVKILLERDEVNPANADNGGRTPLYAAAWSGHESVAKILLERVEVSPEKSDNEGRTPLHAAAWSGHEGVAKILLERDEVTTENPDIEGRTPLHAASWNGHDGVVKLLLERDEANPDTSDSRGQTPLFGASWNGHEGVVKMLLEREEVSPDMPDSKGQTPLHAAAWNGHEGVAKILLERDEVSPERLDNEGRTPLYAAAWNGHEGVAKILLERDEVSPEKLDNACRTPLHSAAWNGHDGVVKLLLERDEVNPDTPDSRGQTPLLGASWNGHEGVVKMLLERDEVSPDMPESKGQTPLHAAAWNGHEGVAKILLEQEEVNPEKLDNAGRTPLHAAAWNGHDGVVKLLLELDEIDPDTLDNRGRTPLLGAARKGHEGAVKMLLEQDRVNPDNPNNNGRTPLLFAALSGHDRVVKMLLERDEVNPTVQIAMVRDPSCMPLGTGTWKW